MASLLAGRGATVLDADRMAHRELERPEVRGEVVRALGEGVRGPDGRIERRAVAEAVFGRPERLRALEAILHPRVLAAFEAEIERRRAPPGEPREVVVLDAPLLWEAGGRALCDERLFVEASPETRARRARERGWAEGEIERREARQVPLEEKRAAATYVIDNDGDLARTEEQVDRFWRERLAPRLV